ncbi:MAG: peptidase domain-containing ABC transporter [Bacteroidales bacterium]|jgi:ATP-binding cassette subfamily B protein|nr:peptidase domain-containing ABC transporter [Bacteroidales bacterium]
MPNSFPLYQQLDAMDCGPTCLRMVAKYYGRRYSVQTLREKSFITRAGVSLLGISDAAESIGFRTMGVKITFEQLVSEVPLPCIVHWNQNHFVVLYRVKEKRSGFFSKGASPLVRHELCIADPAGSKNVFTEEEFKKCWLSSAVNGEHVGMALLLEPTPAFYEEEEIAEAKHASPQQFRFFLRYLFSYKKQMIQVVLGLFVAMVLQLILPFLTQSMVDIGIGTGNINFIWLVLVAQLIVFATQLAVDCIRGWIMLHVTTRINISLISDYLAKLMKLPMRFFDSKNVGDIMQRIGDHSRIETFLTGSSLNTLFSLVNFVIFAFVLAYFSAKILLIFLVGNTLYVAWVLFFMKYRRKLDHKRFAQAASEQSNLLQLITGMQEIKLNNCEKQKRWQWERIQVKLFKIGIKGLAIGQYQQIGSVFFSQTTNILVSFIAAQAVVSGTITLGMMMSVSYIIGQLSSPIAQFIDFAKTVQDARISLERLNEIHQQEDEDQAASMQITELPHNKTLHISNCSFSYDAARRDYVLSDINLEIPQQKITAIVGESGSGKTTLVKLLLGFYAPNTGEIVVGAGEGGISLKNINPHLWRQRTGAVLQDGFIFSDTIARNIAVSDEIIDVKQLRQAATIANIQEFIDSLPLGYNTKIGMEGSGISQGQRQRILIARMVYKNPDFLFFDEATNALDAKNERIIMEHLQEFYKGKTVVVVAHRLSTVQHAHNIVVMEKGRIAEQGTHRELTERRGTYYNLVKNQLELGN